MSFAKFREDFGAAAFRAFLLWDGIVCACKASRDAVLARGRAFTNALDLSSVTATRKNEWCGM